MLSRYVTVAATVGAQSAGRFFRYQKQMRPEALRFVGLLRSKN